MAQRISWTGFDTYLKCPLWYSWSYPDRTHNTLMSPPGSHPNPYTGQLKPWTKDTQHLVRGNASQGLIDQWVNDCWYLLPDQEQQRLLDLNIDSVINRSMTEGKLNGAPTVSEESIKEEIYPNLQRAIRVLTTFYEMVNPDPQTRIAPQTQQEVISAGPFGMDLLAVTDLVFFNEVQEAVIVEGKSTRKPSKATHDQLRWQMEIFKTSNRPIANKNFYLFYSTGQLWDVSFTDQEHAPWLLRRDELLREIHNGKSTPEPGPFECSICPHARKCPWKHTPIKRVEPAIEINFYGRRTSSLD